MTEQFFGYDPELVDGTTPGANIGAAPGRALTMAGTFDVIGVPPRFFSPPENFPLTRFAAYCRNNSGSDANWAIAVYEYTPSQDILVFGELGAKVAQGEGTILSADNTWAKRYLSLIAPYTLDGTKTYIGVVASDAETIVFADGPESATTDSIQRMLDGPTDGSFAHLDNPWGSGGFSLQDFEGDPAVQVFYDDALAAPTLTAPYDALASSLGDVVSIPSKFVDATEYDAVNLPEGCSIDTTTGEITGTVGSPLSGTPLVIAKNIFTPGVTAAIPWTVFVPQISKVQVSGGSITLDGSAFTSGSNAYLSPFGLLTGIGNNGPLGKLSGSGDDLIVNGNTITSPAALYISPNGKLTDVPNGAPVANFLVN